MNDIKQKRNKTFGDGTISRSFTHIDDAIKIIQLLQGFKKKKFNEILILAQIFQ